MISRPESELVFAVERVSAVTLKPEAQSVLITVGPMFPVAPATATFLIVEDIL